MSEPDSPLPPTEAELRSGARQLEGRLDEAFAVFQAQHEALIRSALQVPDTVTDLEPVLACTFLGHALGVVRHHHGTAQTVKLVHQLLDEYDQVDRAAEVHRGRLQ